MPVVLNWDQLLGYVPGQPSPLQQTYLVQIVNCILRSAGSLQDTNVGMLFRDALHTSGGRLHLWPDAVIDCAGQLIFEDDDIEDAREVPRPAFPAPVQVVVPVDPWALNTNNRARLANARTQLVTQRGNLLATAAEQMEGWFYWVNSGESTARYYAQPRHITKPWDPRINRHKRSRDVYDQLQGVTIRRDTFLSWLLRNGKQPQIDSNLNCWEAVMFSAFRAGLVNQPTLATLHQPGPNLLGVTYRDRYLAFLGYNDSFAYNPAGGLVPQRGDVIFWGADEHVAVCVDIDTTGAEPVVTLMNHWSPRGEETGQGYDTQAPHPRFARFHRITMDSLNPRLIQGHECRFAPCPF